MSRFVSVRLRVRTLRPFENLAAARWRTLARVCEEIVHAQLRVPHSVPRGRVPMPFGIDVVLELDDASWSLAKKVSKEADITIGQLCRHLLERHLAETSRAVGPQMPSARAS